MVGKSRPPNPGRAKVMHVAIVEPDPLARAVLAELFESRSWVVTALDGVDHLASLRGRVPEYVLLAVAWGGGGLSTAVRRIRRAAPTAVVVVLAIPSAKPDPLMAFHAGARGYVIKESDMRALPAMLRRHRQDGTPPLSPGVAELLIQGLGGPAASSGESPSEREFEVLKLVGEGLTNREIADALTVSVSTVKTHIHSLLAKLALTNRVKLALLAQRQRDREPNR